MEKKKKKERMKNGDEGRCVTKFEKQKSDAHRLETLYGHSVEMLRCDLFLFINLLLLGYLVIHILGGRQVVCVAQIL